MRGLHVERGRVLVRDDLPDPVPAAGEVLVRVLSAGVCATDLALARGYMGFSGVPGHEFVGIALDGVLAGRRVVGEINAACGSCATCRRGLPRHCPERTVLGIRGRSGAFAERIVLPEGNLLAVPDSLDSDLATFAEPSAAAFEIGEQLDLGAHRRALVLGDGRLGILCAQVLALAGLEVLLAGRHPGRGDWLPSSIRHVGGFDATAGSRFDLVVEASGDPGVLATALLRVEPRGTVVLKTTVERPAMLDLATLVVDEVTVLGSRCGSFEPALEALASGRLVVRPMIHGRYSLREGAAALARADEPGVLKILIDVHANDAQ